jgi:ribosomal protein S18 acetylase RimI-like enzyme
MDIEIVEEGPENLAAYGTVSISYLVTEVYEVDPPRAGNAVATLTARPLALPVMKDYDSFLDEAPVAWASRFDLTGWRFLSACVEGERVGGAAVVARCSGIDMLEGRDDLAVLWDFRVAPAVRRLGVGSALLQAVETYARTAGLRELRVETQNVNVPACRFYASHGFELQAALHGAYPALPDEVQLLWCKTLHDSRTTAD